MGRRGGRSPVEARPQLPFMTTKRIAHHWEKKYGMCPHSHTPAVPLEDRCGWAMCPCGKEVRMDSKGNLKHHHRVVKVCPTCGERAVVQTNINFLGKPHTAMCTLCGWQGLLKDA